MKRRNITYKIIFTLISLLVSVQDIMANNEPPMPKTNGGFRGTYVVGQGAIDQHIVILLLIGMISGIYFMLKLNSTNDKKSLS